MCADRIDREAASLAPRLVAQLDLDRDAELLVVGLGVTSTRADTRRVVVWTARRADAEVDVES